MKVYRIDIPCLKKIWKGIKGKFIIKTMKKKRRNKIKAKKKMKKYQTIFTLFKRIIKFKDTNLIRKTK